MSKVFRNFPSILLQQCFATSSPDEGLHEGHPAWLAWQSTMAVNRNWKQALCTLISAKVPKHSLWLHKQAWQSQRCQRSICATALPAITGQRQSCKQKADAQGHHALSDLSDHSTDSATGVLCQRLWCSPLLSCQILSQIRVLLGRHRQ